jgi:adenosylmethionine-8-amino-7-oxononanoate aminotransferase
MKTASKTETAYWAKLDHDHLWHPFTQMEEWLAEEPLVIEKGDGVFLYDTDGNRYIDAVASIWCNVHGHNHPYLNKALIEQASKISHTTLLGLTHPSAVKLAQKLCAVLPSGLTKIFYSDSGAGAVEAGLKMAVQYWHAKGEKRLRFLVFEGAYHGDTFGSMSLGYSELFHKPFEALVFPVFRLKPPYLFQREKGMSVHEAEEASLAEAQKILEAHASEIAACVVEPLVQGAAGIWPHSSSYLKRLFTLVKQFGLLFMADEVAVGFGRTGRLFAVEHAEITPDLLCLGKGLSGGYLPLSATVATEEIFQAFLAPYEAFKQFFHGHTFSGNPLACAVGLASLEIFEKENTLKRLQPRIQEFWRFLQEEVQPHPHVREVRGFGFFAGIELGKTKNEAYPLAFRAGKKVMLAARKHGIIFRPLLDTIVLCPPLNITEGILKELLNGILKSIEEVCQ